MIFFVNEIRYSRILGVKSWIDVGTIAINIEDITHFRLLRLDLCLEILGDLALGILKEMT